MQNNCYEFIETGEVARSCFFQVDGYGIYTGQFMALEDDLG